MGGGRGGGSSSALAAARFNEYNFYWDERHGMARIFYLLPSPWTFIPSAYHYYSCRWVFRSVCCGWQSVVVVSAQLNHHQVHLLLNERSSFPQFLNIRMKFNISLLSVLLLLVCMLGYVEMVSTFISHHRPLLARFKPQVSLVIIRWDI